MNVIHVARLINNITQVPIQLLGAESEIIFSLPETFRKTHFHLSAKDLFDGHTSLPILHELLTYYVLDTPENDGVYLLLGPVWLKKPSVFDKDQVKHHFSGTEKKRKTSVLDYLPIFSAEQFIQIVQLCYYTLYQCELSDLTLLPQDTAHISSSLQSVLTTQNQFERREFSLPHNSYLEEKRFLEAVKSGDVALVKKLYAKPTAGTAGKLSDDPLRNQKNLFIAHITLLTRAAVDGGLSNEDAYTMSDAYINRSEYCTRIKDILALKEQSLLDFTECIAKTKYDAFSPLVKKSIDYISLHLHYDISLTAIAKSLNIAPSYLSRLFHQETGSTLVSYTQKERIHAAQNMLRFSDYSYLEIATYLNFKSQSYFISVFKKITGLTPMQYRKKTGA